MSFVLLLIHTPSVLVRHYSMFYPFLTIVEAVLDMHMFNLVVCTVIWFTVMLLEVCDIYIKVECIHRRFNRLI